MADSAKKCAHDVCSCMVMSGQKYCSPACEASKDMTTLKCECGHPACAANKI